MQEPEIDLVPPGTNKELSSAPVEGGAEFDSAQVREGAVGEGVGEGAAAELETPAAAQRAPEHAARAEESKKTPSSQQPFTAPLVAPTVLVKDEVTEQVEQILAEDLGKLYVNMPDDEKAKFKQRGEEIASMIGEMVRTAKVNLHKIMSWIRGWLEMIPGVNRFFLEQEAKIKADKILEINKQEEE